MWYNREVSWVDGGEKRLGELQKALIFTENALIVGSRLPSTIALNRGHIPSNKHDPNGKDAFPSRSSLATNCEASISTSISKTMSPRFVLWYNLRTH
jgi:hypothetical protein